MSEINYNDRTGYDESVLSYYNDLTNKMHVNTDNQNAASQNKYRVIELNKSIQNRRANYNTYKNQIEMQKELYNREKNKTLVLGISTAAALIGCIVVWKQPTSV